MFRSVSQRAGSRLWLVRLEFRQKASQPPLALASTFLAPSAALGQTVGK